VDGRRLKPNLISIGEDVRGESLYREEGLRREDFAPREEAPHGEEALHCGDQAFHRGE